MQQFQVFKVTIHYKDRSTMDYNVIAQTDTQARVATIEKDRGVWKEHGRTLQVPKIAYCETVIICVAYLAKTKSKTGSQKRR